MQIIIYLFDILYILVTVHTLYFGYCYYISKLYVLTIYLARFINWV